MNVSRPPSASKANAIAKWFGLQIAAKAVSLALGAPLISGAIMGVLAYAQGLPVAWGFLGVIVAAAATSTMLNQARSFMIAYSVSGKVSIYDAKVKSGMNLDKTVGYLVTIEFKNTADVPLQYHIDRFSGHIDNRIIARPGRSGEMAGLGGIISPGSGKLYTVGMAVMSLEKDKHLEGELEVTYSYGRLGKLNYINTEKFVLAISTGGTGTVKHSGSFRTLDARIP
jgi:hypothetical protein